MSVYLETSCLLKLVLDEPDSPAVEAALEGETDILVSTLARLEAESVLLAMRLGGELSKRQLTVAKQTLDLILTRAPFRPVRLPADACETALRQLAGSPGYCRTFDRLHLAAAEALGPQRFMTADRAQANAATALGLEVVSP
jgi:hypothetical protein